MRSRKSFINLVVNISTYIISFLPLFVVRKSIINYLNPEILGLTSLYTNVLSYISIVEMGIGTAIIYSLYKPYAEKNLKKVSAYINFYKSCYIKAGVLVLGLGILITPFLHYFIKGNIDLTLVRVGFIIVLINTFVGYIFTYKHSILNVAQENYKVSLTITLAKIFIAILQIIVIMKYKSFYLYLLVQLVINLISYLILNKYINKRFEYINKNNEQLDLEEKKGLYKNIKALFCHKIGSIFVLGTDNLVVSSFIGLKIVGIYNNYILITNAFSGVISSAMNGLTASIGNLLVEKDNEYSYNIHKKIFFISFWVISFIIISLFNTIDHFIVLWMGEKFVLDFFTVSLILFNLYFMLMRNPTDQFKNASGEYYRDRYAPIAEGLINLISSIILVNLIGLPGVFIGTLLSNLLVVFWVKPYIVYKYVFDKPLIEYFKLYFKYLFIGIIPLCLTMFLTQNVKEVGTIGMFLWNCCINVVVINAFYLIIFWRNEEFQYFKNIAIKMLGALKKKVKLN